MTLKVTDYGSGRMPEMEVETDHWMVNVRTFGWHDATPDATVIEFSGEIKGTQTAIPNGTSNKVAAALEKLGVTILRQDDYKFSFNVNVASIYSRKRELVELVARTLEGMDGITS